MRYLLALAGALAILASVPSPSRAQTPSPADSVAAEAWSIEPLLAARISLAARAHSIPPEIAFSLVRVESNFDRRAESWAGALGLTQVMPRTGWHFCGLHPHHLYNPWLNLTCGFSYLRHLHERFASWPRALASYNVGPTRHARAPTTGEYDGYYYASLVLGSNNQQ